jgi:hypothetical protein
VAIGRRIRRGQSGAEQGAATALALPGGSLLLLVAGAALIGVGLWQLVRAAKADFLRHLDGRVAGEAWVKWLGRGGYAARGSCSRSSAGRSSRRACPTARPRAGGMEQALGSLSGTLLSAVALGLLLFGLFSFVEARYRGSTIRRWRRG